MIIKKDTDFILKYCNSCGWKVSEELIKTILENNLSKIYCNKCGNELMKENIDALGRNHPFLVEQLATSKDIGLRMYLTIKKTKATKKIEKAAFYTASNVLYNLIEQEDLPRFVKSKSHLQKMIDNKNFLCKGQKGFEKLSDQENIKYGGIIYTITCLEPFNIYPELIDKVYIGRTWKTKMKRFTEHIRDAIEKYMKERKMPKRKIEYAILVGITDFLNNTYFYDCSMNPLDDFIEKKIYKKDPWQIKQVISDLAKRLQNTYFNIDVIEVHRNYETTKNREVWWIKNYLPSEGNKLVRDTLYPNGLNMIDFPTKIKHISLPIYDIIFLISLGYDGPIINQMLEKYYGIIINFRTIYRTLKKFWGDWDKILEKFFKPVLQGLLGHQDNFDWQDIAITLHRHPSYRNKKNFCKWFFGLNITNLKFLINRNDFSWNNLESLAKDLIKDINDNYKIKGISKDHWIEWFIKDIGLESISKILGYKNKNSLVSSWKKHNRSKSIFQQHFADTYTDAVKKYRKSRVIELLTSEDSIDILLNSRLYWIYINEFGFKKWQDLAMSRPSQG